MENIDLGESNNNRSINNPTTERFKSNGATQFTIPALKIQPKLLGGSQELSKSSSNISKFLLKQLNKDEQTNTTNRFNVPQLKQHSTFKIPELKIGQLTKVADTANELTKTQQTLTTNVLDKKPINSLNPSTNEACRAEDNIIDLTAALSTTRIGNNNNSIRGNQRNKEKTEQFEIPFIDCDRSLPPTNEYCGIDISNVKYKHNLVQPSTLGKILSSKNNRLKIKREEEVRKLKPIAKHQIERFLFETQSPDDLVLAALNRFTRP